MRSKEALEKMFAKSREEQAKKKNKTTKQKKVKRKRKEIYVSDVLDEWKTDKEFLIEKYNFYYCKKRKRKIDKDIAMILYYIINGTKELDIPDADVWEKQIDFMFPSQVAYIKKVYDNYLTDKFTKKILNKKS